LDKEICTELTRVKEKLLEFQQAKKAMKQINDGACIGIGAKSELEAMDIKLSDPVK
jgi:hypothetical protein